jgi:hypothetical protein
VDRERFLDGVPGDEDDREAGRKDGRRRFERDAVVVGEVVADQRADDADQHDGEPVDPGDVAARAELEDERDDQQCGHDVARVRQPEAEVFVEQVGRCLADGRAEDLDHPEVDRDLGHLVEHLTQGRLRVLAARGAAGEDRLCGVHRRILRAAV